MIFDQIELKKKIFTEPKRKADFLTVCLFIENIYQTGIGHSFDLVYITYGLLVYFENIVYIIYFIFKTNK